jgi:sirohydrochlorin cobaltochelatase
VATSALGNQEMSPVTARQALLLIAHGSSRYPDAARPLWRHVDAIRLETPDTQVEVGLLNSAPKAADVLATIPAPLVRVVPFFMETGYFTNVAIPRALGPDPRVRYCPPVGLHPAMADIVENQGRAGCATMSVSPAEAAILVVGHGSASAPGRTLAMHAHAASLAERRIFGQVATACLEEPPLLPDALRLLAAWPVVVIGFFAGEGMHVRDDVPSAIAAEQARRGAGGPDVRLHGSVTDDPSLRRIIRAQAGIEPSELERDEREETKCSPI